MVTSWYVYISDEHQVSILLKDLPKHGIFLIVPGASPLRSRVCRADPVIQEKLNGKLSV